MRQRVVNGRMSALVRGHRKPDNIIRTANKEAPHLDSAGTRGDAFAGRHARGMWSLVRYEQSQYGIPASLCQSVPSRLASVIQILSLTI